MLMREYIGPKGYGANPEFGGDPANGRRRMQSLDPLNERLTPTVKARIMKEFEPFNADIKKIDKTAKGHVRIWYNNDEALWS